jgi:hypothetical protein
MRIKPGRLIFSLILLAFFILFILAVLGVFTNHGPPAPQ